MIGKRTISPVRASDLFAGSDFPPRSFLEHQRAFILHDLCMTSQATLYSLLQHLQYIDTASRLGRSAITSNGPPKGLPTPSTGLHSRTQIRTTPPMFRPARRYPPRWALHQPRHSTDEAPEAVIRYCRSVTKLSLCPYGSFGIRSKSGGLDPRGCVGLWLSIDFLLFLAYNSPFRVENHAGTLCLRLLRLEDDARNYIGIGLLDGDGTERHEAKFSREP
jgi:hypothetical protein